MINLQLILKLTAPVILLVGCLHLVLGVNAEVMLGANLSLATVSDPVLDSQNRFYGVAFTLYGFLLYVCATDLTKYQSILRLALWVFFAAGCTRFVSLVIHGLPSDYVLILMALELLMPPLGLVWLSKTLAMNDEKRDA